MSYAQRQRDPRRHVFGIASAVLIHIAIAYALLNGLAQKIAEVIKKPVEVTLIKEVKLEPHVPEPKPRTHQKPSPPAYVPPPEVTPPASTQETVTVVTQTLPPTTAPNPTGPVGESAPRAIVAVGLVCPNHQEVRSRVQYPAQALRQGISGEVEVEFVVAPSGSIGDVTVIRSSNRIFNTAATAAVAQFRCVGHSGPVRVRVPFAFRFDS